MITVLHQTSPPELDVTGSANIGLGPANATSSADPEEINSSRFVCLFVCLYVCLLLYLDPQVPPPARCEHGSPLQPKVS